MQAVMLGICIFLSFCLSVVHSQFPRLCTTSEALDTKSCCPVWEDQSPCGVRSGRGRCRDWVVFTEFSARQVPQYDDDRLDWPRHYYDKTCECYGNYGGFNCGGCKPGYFGNTCNRKKIVVREDIRQLSFLERNRLFSYLALAKTTVSKDYVVLSTGDRHHRDTYQFKDASIYDVFSWIHYYSMKPILRNGTLNSTKNYAHKGPAFPGWHRLGLMFLEQQIQLLTGDEAFALPYYDWRGDTSCSVCTNTFLGDNDVQGRINPYSPFASWKAICSGFNYPDAYCPYAGEEYQMERLHRKPGTDPVARRLPSIQDVEDTLKWRDFDTPPYNEGSRRSFRNAMEGFLRPSDGTTLERNMHNLFHIYIGGTMAQVPISSNDPLFVLHHCYIDKIFEAWIVKYNGNPTLYPDNNEPGQGPNECSTPYFPCYQNKYFLQRSTIFGYRYSVYKDM
ncbi:tyrosinase-like [Discoglossus pictus]